MKRTRIVVVLIFVVLILPLAFPALARADDGSVASSPDPAPDGWTWDDASVAQPSG